MLIGHPTRHYVKGGIIHVTEKECGEFVSLCEKCAGGVSIAIFRYL